MRKILLILLLILTVDCSAQFPIIEEFNIINTPTTWSTTGTAGIQNYGGVENYATFNVGNTPYPNNATIRIISPLYDLTTCASGLTVSFPLEGKIEKNYDYMYFEYFNAGIWTILGTFTSTINPTTTYTYAIPNTTTRFRFRLVTDISVNTWAGGTQVYYYDITRVTISCDTPLPIELISFTGEQHNESNILKWITAAERNNDYFTVERSFDAVNFEEVGRVNGSGNSISNKSYSLIDTRPFDGVTYYRLTQTDYDGKSETFEIISVSRISNGPLKVIKMINMLGQTVNEGYDGVIIYYFSDGSVIKKYKIK